jgi:hypothetical protein
MHEVVFKGVNKVVLLVVHEVVFKGINEKWFLRGLHEVVF